MNTLMNVSELNNRMTSGQRTVVLDVRWALGDPHGREHYVKKHIPGAVYVDLAAQLAEPSDGTHGRHPLPPVQKFQEYARSWGISSNDVVVAYDDNGNLAAARLWWMLRNAGLNDVFLLDGGLRAWCDAGLHVEGGLEQAVPGGITLGDSAMPAISAEEAAEWARHGTLLDARAGERYRGEIEPVDPRAGHIPGAISAPTSGNLASDGKFLAPADLRRRFSLLGVSAGSPTAVYCGSGVTAAHEIAALEIAGYTAALYPGSFSEWSSNPDNPVATGPAAHGELNDSAIHAVASE